LFEEHALRSVVGREVADGISDPDGLALRILQACTPFKKRVLDMDAAGSPLTRSSKGLSDAWWDRMIYDSRDVPVLERTNLEILKSPSSSKAGDGINLPKAVVVLEGNVAQLEVYLQDQQQDLKVALSGFGKKLNSLGVVNAALDRRIGYAEGFGEDYGMDSAFSGLRYLQELTMALGGTGAFEATPYAVIVKSVSDLSSDMVAAKARLESIDIASIKEAHADLKAAVYGSMRSLKKTYLQPLLAAHKLLMNSWGTIITRVETLEEMYRTLSVDKDLFGGLMAGTFHASRNEIRGSHDVGLASARLTELEKSSTELRSELNELRHIVAATTASAEQP
jgi:hypothetical protein